LHGAVLQHANAAGLLEDELNRWSDGCATGWGRFLFRHQCRAQLQLPAWLEG
jgi:hypothetical protein